MKLINKKLLVLGFLPIMLLSTSCSKAPAATDYSKESNWAMKKIVLNSTYDVVFIIGTSVMTPSKSNGVAEICDAMKTTGLLNFETMRVQLTDVKSSDDNVYKSNIYVPMYRQMALSYALDNYTKHNDIIDDVRNKEPIIDLKAMLNYYFTNCNKDAQRPFVLAGHSQGSAALQVMFEDYFIKGGHKSYLKNCIALYSLGYGVSKKWFNTLNTTIDEDKTFHLATGATDTSCVISWNTEGPNGGDGNMLLADDKYDTYLINPLNWKTDGTPATKSENLGVLIDNPNYDPTDPTSPKRIVSTLEEDKFDATINVERGSLVVSEPHKGKYVNIPPYGAIWGGKSLHNYDGPAFFANMGRNLGDRLDSWFGK